MQKVQAVNVDLSPFTDPNANPTLHQMVAQMISDKVVVTLNESDQPAPDSATAARLAGFPVQLLSARKDSPKLVVGGAHALNIPVDRARRPPAWRIFSRTQKLHGETADCGGGGIRRGLVAFVEGHDYLSEIICATIW